MRAGCPRGPPGSLLSIHRLSPVSFCPVNHNFGSSHCPSEAVLGPSQRQPLIQLNSGNACACGFLLSSTALLTSFSGPLLPSRPAHRLGLGSEIQREPRSCDLAKGAACPVGSPTLRTRCASGKTKCAVSGLAWT